MKRIIPALLMVVGVSLPAFAQESSTYTLQEAQRQNEVQLEVLRQAREEPSEEYSRLDAAQPLADVVKTDVAKSDAAKADAAKADATTTKTGVHKLVTKYALKHGIDPALAHAIVKVESNYNCNAKNPRSSATGLMQTLVPTARGVGVTGNLRDCSTSLEAGMRYLKQAIAKHGEGCAGASAYNLGHYGSSRCTGYGKKVMSIASRMNVAGD
jgi:soluble lytic murein transglycosylase-like protein